MKLRLLFAAAAVALLASPPAASLMIQSPTTSCHILVLHHVYAVADPAVDAQVRVVEAPLGPSVAVAYRCHIDPPLPALPLDGCTGTLVRAETGLAYAFTADQLQDLAPAETAVRAALAAQGEANAALVQDAKYDAPGAVGDWQRATVTNAEGTQGSLSGWAPGYAGSRPAEGAGTGSAAWTHVATWYGCI